jgi:hypothetical protein
MSFQQVGVNLAAAVFVAGSSSDAIILSEAC